MGSSIRLGRILGIPISLHYSWFIIFVLFTLLLERHFGQDQSYRSWAAEERWAVALATSLLFFFSVLVHELSHSLVAIRRGIAVKGITLFVLGGVSQIAREAQRPSTEFMVAVVGPFSSIIIGFVFLGLAVGLEDVSEHLSAAAWILFSGNILVGIFNMLPGFPLDGGRVLRAVVWRITRNYWRATRLAAMGGQAIAVAMIAIGIALIVIDRANLIQGLWLVGLGLFLQAVASASRRQSRLEENLDSYKAGDVMSTNWPEAPVDITLSRLMDEYIKPSGSEFLVLSRAGTAQGVITRRLVEHVPQHKWAETWAGSVMVALRGAVAVGPEERAYDLIELMDRKDVKEVLVIERGVLLGFISRDAIQRRAGMRAHSRA